MLYVYLRVCVCCMCVCVLGIGVAVLQLVKGVARLRLWNTVTVAMRTTQSVVETATNLLDAASGTALRTVL